MRRVRGAALVETALSLSVVLGGMFAAVQFDYTSFQQLQLDEMAQLGARQVASASNIQAFVASAALGVPAANVSATPAADGHVPLQSVTVTQNNLPGFFGLVSPPTLRSQAAETQFSGNFSGGNGGAYPVVQATGFYFDAGASLAPLGGYPYDVPCIPPAQSGGYPETPPPAPIVLELPLLLYPPPRPSQPASPALPAATACTNEMGRQLGLFTRINEFGNGTLGMDDYINELACHTAWYLYVATNVQTFNGGLNPDFPPSVGGWLYNANPEDYVNQPPANGNPPYNASWIDMASDFIYMYSLDSGPPLNGQSFANCQFPMWFSMNYDPNYGGFPGASDPTQPGDIWPN